MWSFQNFISELNEAMQLQQTTKFFNNQWNSTTDTLCVILSQNILHARNFTIIHFPAMTQCSSVLHMCALCYGCNKFVK